MMNHHLSIIVECPTPIGPMPAKLTSNAPSAFVEHVLLRIVPLVDDAIVRERPIALALTPSALEPLRPMPGPTCLTSFIQRAWLGILFSESG